MNLTRFWQRPHPDADNPWIAQQLGADDHTAALHRARRDWRVIAGGLFLLCVGSMTGNWVQYTQPKEPPYLVAVDEHGVTVPTLFRRPEMVPESDPMKQAILRNYLQKHIENWRSLVFDEGHVAGTLTAARMESVGPALVKFNAALAERPPWERIKHEKVTIIHKGPPMPVIGDVWQAEWKEEVSDTRGHVLRVEEWKGQFQLAHDDRWTNPFNLFGVKVADILVEPVGQNGLRPATSGRQP